MSSSSFLGLTRENALQRDAEVQHQERLHVQVSLTAANVGDRGRIQRNQVVVGSQIRLLGSHTRIGSHRNGLHASVAGSVQGVYVSRDLGNREGMRLLPSPLTERVSAAHVNGSSRTQVGQTEVDAAIASIRRAQQGKERLILIDGKQLPIAERPTLGRETETHDPDLA